MTGDRVSKLHMETPKWNLVSPSFLLITYIIIHQILQNLFLGSILSTPTSIIQTSWALIIIQAKLQENGSTNSLSWTELHALFTPPSPWQWVSPGPETSRCHTADTEEQAWGWSPFSSKWDALSLSLYSTSDYWNRLGVSLTMVAYSPFWGETWGPKTHLSKIFSASPESTG